MSSAADRLSLQPSPLEPSPRLARRLGVDLWIKRDDLLPLAGGGSKVRAAERLLEHMASLRRDAVVTTGGLQSNHARVIAIETARRGWPCALVLHGDMAELGSPTGNLLLMLLAGAEIEIVPPDAIADHLEQAAVGLRSRGLSPFVLAGGGHVVEGALAYAEAAQELASQCAAVGWAPEWIVLACGTGTIQAGLLAGLSAAGLHPSVVGVSIARELPRGREAVVDMYAQLCTVLDLRPDTTAVRVDDRWIGGGYDQPTAGVGPVIETALSDDGLILDPTYTGKAALGLFDLVRSGEIPAGARVLFWHTGAAPSLFGSAQVRNGGLRWSTS